MEKLVLIDGNSLINRAFYAMPVLTTKNGEYTNAVYGFMNMFFKMLLEEKPTYVAVAFDLKAPTFRHKMYDGYKATRKPMPVELRPQIPLLKEVLSIMGVKTFEKEGSEADDIIGTIAKATDVKTIIITGDKDSFQLVDEQTEVHFTKRGITDIDVYDINNFAEKTSLTPPQIIDLKALMGDSSDNIPGIQGIGEKTAKTLLEKYGTVDNVLSHIEEQTGKLKEKLLAGKESAMLSKTLATIDCECGVDTSLANMTFSFPFSQSVKRKFIELEFKSLYKRDELFDTEPTKDAKQPENTKSVEIVEITDLSSLPNIDYSSPISIVVKDNSVNFSDNKTEYQIKIKQTLFDEGFNLSQALNFLQPLFLGDKPIVVFSKKHLKHFLLKTVGLTISAPCDDVQIMKYVGDFSGKEETLDDVILEYGLSENMPAHSLLCAYYQLKEKIESEQMTSLYRDVELPLADVLFDMEVSGFKVDLDALNSASETYHALLTDIEKQIRDIAGEQTLNVNSPKQLGELIFEKLKLGKGKKTKTGYSTTAEILESLETTHPVIPLILRHRHLQKLLSTYIDGFRPLIDKNTGLIHTTFNQTLTSTGRLSSKEPNLQNIPVRDDEGKELRKFFIPKSSERILIGADYSQIELRLLACFSNCKSLIEAFNNGKDIHMDTAQKVFAKGEKPTPAMRSKAKAVNFGIIYGMSEFGLAKTLKVSNAEARNYITSYFNEYPEVKAYMDKNVAFAKEKGYATTLLGRRRYIRELSSSNYNLRQFGERVAMNMPLQGSSADIIKIAMIRVHERIKKENLKSQLILQVHDELIVDTFTCEKEQIEKILIEEMEGAVDLAVKLTVGLGSGKTWFDAK